MAIPKYDEIQYEALNLLNDGKERRLKDFTEPLGVIFKLTDTELLQEYESGNGLIFKDRISWALSYLNMADLVEKPKRGIYKINGNGVKALNDKSGFRSFIKNKLSKRSSKSRKGVTTTNVNDNETPSEALFKSFEGIRDTVYTEIIETIQSKTPIEFEKLVVGLLQKMGYGGEIQDSGTVTQYSNDNGIDGIIKEDILGFGKIYIQAKRYKTGNNISREDIQKFVGALASTQSDKGVFITTSDFTKGAYTYSQSLGAASKIVLINGKRLAKHIYDFDFGMQISKTIIIKKLDTDFWDNLQDDKP